MSLLTERRDGGALAVVRPGEVCDRAAVGEMRQLVRGSTLIATVRSSRESRAR